MESFSIDSITKIFGEYHREANLEMSSSAAKRLTQLICVTLPSLARLMFVYLFIRSIIELIENVGKKRRV